MDIEQAVVGRAPFGWRGQCCQSCLADVVEAARPEQLDCRQKRGGLFRRDGESVDPQQSSKGHEDVRGARQSEFIAHAAASASRASSRPEMKVKSSSSLSATPIDRLNASGQRVPPLCNSVAASAQSTASAMPGALLSGSRLSFPTAATTARAVDSATLEARIMMISASRSAVGYAIQ